MVETDHTSQFAGKRVVVMGLGRFGGGVGVTRFLVDRGADVLVTDLEPADKLEQSVAKIQDLIDAGSVTLRLGEHNVSDFTTCDLLVVNPAVKPGNRFVRAAEAAGIEVTTEMRLLVQRLPNRQRTIGVTGSAGKSTVTAMIGHVLKKAFSADPTNADPISAAPISGGPQGPAETSPSPRVWVGGNIGVSLLPVVDQIGREDWVVLELSSFMLDRLRADAHFPGWSPHIAVITNISSNHLDWHGSMEKYVAAKEGIVIYQFEEDFLVLGPGVMADADLDLAMRQTWEECDANDNLPLQIPGNHNQLNAAMAVMAIRRACAGIDAGHVSECLIDFPGLPHRLQFVGEHEGVRYYNDSKCTTPDAAKLAVQAFLEGGDKPDKLPGVHLILGGKDKGSDMSALAAFASEKCKAVYTIGALGDTIAGLCEGAAGRAVPDRPNSCGGVSWPAASAEVVRCGELDKAVAEIFKRVAPGDVVLLSPACASWDQFENYEARGARFIELVKMQARD